MNRRHRLRWVRSVALTATLIAASTTSCSPPPEEPTCERDKASFSLNAKTYADVGKPGDAKGNSQPSVVILDEQHASRVGQVEIAVMLNRLYHNDGLRDLALEGSVVEKPAPDLSWFTSLPDPSIRTATALELLRQGEVSAAEFAAMVLPGFQLHAIEHDEEYQVLPPDAAATSFTGYMTAIAVTTMTPEQITQATSLLDQNKHEDAINLIIGSNPWTSERYELLQRTDPIATTEEMRKLGDELAQKAQEVSADVGDYRSDFEATRKFYDAAVRRSNTMVANTIDLTTRTGECAPLFAMNVGAAHTTEVTDLLRQDNMSYAVVSPASLSSDSPNGSLSNQAYDRKLNAQSVDPANTLGAYLDGRRKPPPASTNEWFKAKAQLSYAMVAIARAAAGGSGEEPPWDLNQKDLGLGGSGPEKPHIAIDLSTIRVVPVNENGNKRQDVIFAVKLLTEPTTTLWGRVGVVADKTDSGTLEQALKKMRYDLLKEPPIGDPPPSPEPVVVTLTPDVKAAIAGAPEPLMSVKLTG